jgi:hypothetical protein
MIKKSQTKESDIITRTSVLSCQHCGKSSEEIIPPDM